MNTVWHERFPGAAGIVPEFLDPDNALSAKDQIDQAYAHGGGWREFDGFTLKLDWADPRNCELLYPGDPPMSAKAYCLFGEELVVLYDFDWCSVSRPSGTCHVARLD